MSINSDKLALRDEDLNGLRLSDVKCRTCSCFCSERQPVFVDGKPVSICLRKTEGQEVISKWKLHALNDQ